MDWKPIDSFPREGGPFLVCNGEYDIWDVVFWDSEEPSAPLATVDGPNFPLRRFTHWQPLPELPR